MGCLRRLIAIFLGILLAYSFVSFVKCDPNKDAVDEFLDFFKDDDDWKEVLNSDESRSFSDSYPAQQFDTNSESLPKRRRLRKRKRRPITSTTESAESYEEYYRGTLPEIRRKMTNLQDTWEEMLQEPQGGYHQRRKHPPEYQNEVSNPTLTASLRFGGDNLEISKINSNTETTRFSENSDETLDIKTLLKQSGRVSLSEILQRKNLTLSELLKGNRKAISALKSSTTENIQNSYVESSQRDEQKIVQATMEFEPPKISAEAKKGTINRNFEQENHSTEVFKEKDAIKPFSTQKFNTMYTGITKFEVITEPTTEKRIFVPSHPVLYTSVNYKNQPPIILITPTTPRPKISTTTNKSVKNTKKPVAESKAFGNTHKNLPLTNAKLNKRIQLKEAFPQVEKEVIKTTLPPNAIKIDITEIFGFKNKDIDVKSNENNVEKDNIKKSEGPLRFSLNLEISTQKTTISTPKTTISTTTKVTTTTTPTTKMTTTKAKIIPTKKPEVTTAQKLEKLPNKYRPLTPRDEIIQILKDPREKDTLMMILERANMTIEELIDQRKRGSSHTHLADIFHNKIKEPEPSGETYVGTMEITNNHSPFMRQQKSLLENVKTSTTTSTTSTLKPENAPPQILVTSFPSVKIEMEKDVPRRVNVEKIRIPDSIQFTNSREDDRIILLDNNFLDDNLQGHNSDSKFYVANNEPLHLDEDLFINVPSGVKSAMLASFAIIGLSILVFLSILVVFRWNQKRKNKLSCESFGFKKSITKSPIISVPNKKIKTFVNETLGKKNNPYKSYMHTSMDNLWESKVRSNF